MKPPPPTIASPRRRRLFCAVLALFVLVLYAPSLRNEFVYDDQKLIVHNPLVQHLSGIWKAFASPYYPGFAYYRPIGLATYTLDWAIWGGRPGGMRLTNILLHAASCVLVFHLGRRLCAGRFAPAAAAALLFAAHPLCSSLVLPITAREGLLCALFVTATVLLRLRGSRAAFGASLASAALALLSKEQAVVLPVLIFFADRWKALADPPSAAPAAVPPPWWRSVRAALPYVSLAIVYLVVRGLVLGVMVQAPGGARPRELAAVPLSFLYLVQTFVVPPCRLLYEPDRATWLVLWKAALAVLVLAAALAIVLRARNRAAALALVWAVVAFLPTANLVYQETIYDERYLYLSAVGLSILIVLAWHELARRLPAWGRAGAPAVALLVAAGAATTLHRTGAWRDGETFYRAWLAHAPQRINPNYGLAQILKQRGELDAAVAHFERALADMPQDVDSLVALGITLAEREEYAAGETHLRQALRLQPRHAEAHYNLGLALERQGRSAEAVEAYRLAVRDQADHVQAYNNLGLLLGRTGDYDGAIHHFRRALEFQPGLSAARNNLALGLIAQNRYAEARGELEEGLALDPDDAPLMFNLVRLLLTHLAAEPGAALRAVAVAERLCSGQRAGSPEALEMLMLAQTAAAQVERARITGRRAAALAAQQGKPDLAARIQQRVDALNP